jgi:hypothetical protein
VTETAQNTTEATSSQAAAATTEQTGTEAAAEQQQTATETATLLGGTEATAETAAETTTETATEGAPEKYEFKAPEGQQYDPQMLGTFSEVAKELNLPQDKAQGTLDKLSTALAVRQQEQIKAMHESWIEETKTDKEFGGDKLTENLAMAKKAMTQFDPEGEALELLNKTGLGNNLKILRVLARAGKAISEDKFVTGGTSNVTRDPAKVLFPDMA